MSPCKSLAYSAFTSLFAAFVGSTSAPKQEVSAERPLVVPQAGLEVEHSFTVISRLPTAEEVPSEEHRRLITEAELPWRIRASPSGIELVLVPSGSYLRGGSPGDVEAQFDETPILEVAIPEPLYVSVTEVTRGQWARLMAPDEAEPEPGARQLPVTDITWSEAVDFSRRAGLRLPTESEWEYLCRAGNPNPRYGVPAEIAVFKDTAARSKESKTLLAKVGGLAPNAWAIHDTLGNAWEWTATNYTNYANYPSDRPNTPSDDRNAQGLHKVIRGGCCGSPPEDLRASYRLNYDPGSSSRYIGFRVVRSVEHLEFGESR